MAARLLREDEAERNPEQTLLMIQSNCAKCFWKLGHFAECVAACDAVLEIDPRFTKAQWRRGKSFEALGCLSAAASDYAASGDDARKSLGLVREMLAGARRRGVAEPDVAAALVADGAARLAEARSARRRAEAETARLERQPNPSAGFW